MEVVKASLDRFEGNYAIIYSDDDMKYDVPKEIANFKTGSRVLLYLDGGHVVRVEADKESTSEAQDRARKKYERLKKGDHLF